MNIVPVHRSNSGLSIYNPNRGLNGIFGFVKKNIGKWAGAAIKAATAYIGAVVTVALGPFLGSIVGGAIQQYGNQFSDTVRDGFSFDTGKIATDVTAAEAAILDSFFANTFNPYVAQLIREVGAAKALADKSASLAKLNDIENRITAIYEHYNIATQSGLSAFALEQRNAVIYTALNSVHEAVKAVVANLGIQTEVKPVSFIATKYSYAPLFTSPAIINIISDNYMAKTVTTLPETIQTIQPQVKDSPVPATPAPEKKDNSLLYAGLVAAGIFLASRAMGGKKKGRTASKPTAKRKSK